MTVTPRPRARTGVLIALLASVATACGAGPAPDPAAGEPAASPTSTTSATETVNVWFLGHVGDDGPYLIPVGRDVTPEPSPLTAALQALLDGPDDDITTAVPHGTVLNGVSVEDSVATVDLSEEFASGGGSSSVRARLAQVVYTTTEHEGIGSVVIALDGEPVEVFSSEGLVIEEPLERSDFAELVGPGDRDDAGPDDGQALSEPASSMRDEIVTAARAGRLDRLAELALRDDRFTASFGDELDTEEELLAYWRTLEEEHGQDVAGTLIGLLSLEPYTTGARDAAGEEVTIHVWPRAQSDEATEEDRGQLEDLFGAERVARWYADGMYLGWRTGITADGDWRFLVIGD